MSKMEIIVNGLISTSREHGLFQSKQIVNFLDEPISISTVNSYISYLKSANLLEREYNKKEGFMAYKIPDENKLIQESLKGLNHVKKIGRVIKERSANVNGRDISTVDEQINSLDWILNTYIPKLEEKIQKLENENKDLYRQLQNFFGIAKQAKIIHSGKLK